MTAKNVIDRLTSNIQRLPNTDKEIVEAIQNAIEEWESARAYFDVVSEPKLVDYAIYLEAAAKSRYAYWLAEARRRGITVEYENMISEISAV